MNSFLSPSTKFGEITSTIVVGLFVETILLLLLYFSYTKKLFFKQLSVVVVVIELFFFARGNLITAPLASLTIPNYNLNFSTSRYISTSDIVAFTGPHVYWNHLRARQPYAPDLTDEEINTFAELKNQIAMIPGNLNIFNHYFNASGYSAVVLKSYAQYFGSNNVNSVDIKSISDARLTTLGTNYLITGLPEDYAKVDENWIPIANYLPIKIYQRKTSFPRAFFLDSQGRVEITNYQPNLITIETNNSEVDQLILTDSNYPGWEVFIDNKPSSLLQLNPFRVITIPKGEHIISYNYRPKSFYLGANLSLVTAIFLLGKLLISKNTKYK